MASTLKKFLPPGWDDVADGEVIIKSASGVVGGSMSATVGAGSITNAEISPTAAIDVSKLANGSVSNAEFQYLDGVSSALQTQLNGKQASILGTGPSNDGVEFASKVLLHGTEGVVGSNYITGEELFWLNGVTSNIQTQLNGKQPTLSSGDVTPGLTSFLTPTLPSVFSLAFGVINANGTSSFLPTGWSSSRSSEGLYSIDYPLSDEGSWGVVVTCEQENRYASVFSNNNAGFTVSTKFIDATTVSFIDVDWNFIAFRIS